MNSPLTPPARRHSFLDSVAGRALRLALCVLLASATARAQTPGDLDTSFNPGTGADSRVLSIARQADGKLVVAGQFNTFNGQPRNRLTRLNADGSTDPGFNPGSGADSTINAVAVAPDGKILVGGDFYSFAGESRRRLARLAGDGSLDPAFATGLGVDGTVQAVAVQPDGKVLLAGGFTAVDGIPRAHIARLNADGSVDAGFNPGSGANATVLTLALQADGKILLGGYFSVVNGAVRHRVARLNADGTLDTSFVPATLDNGFINHVSLTGDGRILVAGNLYIGLNNRVLRLNADGSRDTGFNPGNNLISSDVSVAVAQNDGKVLIGGYFTSISGVTRNGVARLNADGSLDPAFDPGAGANQLVWTMLLQPDGRLVAGGAFTTYAGVSRNRLTRIHNDGAATNQPPQMAAIGSLTILEDSGSQTVTVTGITPGPAGEAAQSVTNVTAVSSNPALIPHPTVTYTPGATTAALAFAPAADANGLVTISVVAQDNGGTANGGVDRVTNSFTVTVTPVNDAPLLVSQARPATVAFFNDTNFVYTGELPAGGALLTNLGVSVIPFTNFADAVGTWPVIVVPSMHTALAPTLNAAARASISNFVHTGGVLVVMGNHVPLVQVADLMNAAFGYSLVPYRLLAPSVRAAGAAGTPFADDPPSIWANDQESYAFGSLPPNARVIYQRDGVGWDESSVTLFSVGTGRAVTLGGQFSQTSIWSGEGTWLPVLASAITPVQPVLAVSEDAGPQSIAGFASASRSGPTNESAQLVSFLVANDNPALFSSPPALAANGTLSFTPAPNANGAATVTVRAQDDGGTANGGVDTSAPQTFTLTVTPVNDAPSFSLSPAGRVVAWPTDTWLDMGQTTVPAAALSGVTAVAGGWYHSLALKSDGSVLAWGDNWRGAIDVPPQAQSGVVGIAGGNAFSLALKADGTVLAWGSNDYGELDKPADLAGVTAIAAGANHSLALKSDGTVVAWGRNSHGQLAVPPGLNDVVAIAAGTGNSLALKRDGTVVGWGMDWGRFAGETNLIAIDAFDERVLGLRSDGTLVGFGVGADWSWWNATPSNVVAIALGADHALALRSDGTLLTANAGGTPLPTETGVVAISAGESHSLVVRGGVTPAVVVREDSGPRTVAGAVASVSAGPANESAQLVSFLVANDNPALFSSPPALAANGTLSFTPAPNANGAATVTVRAQDDGGTANGGVDTSAPQTFTLTVTPVNDAPTITLTTNLVAVAENSGAYSANLFASVSVGPADEAAAQALTNVTILSVGNPSLFSAGPALALDGTLTFTPAANAPGSALVTFAAQDNGGTANGGVDRVTNSFTITVLPLNHAPSFSLVGLTGQAGSLAWARALAGAGAGFQVARDANGNAYAAGYVNRATGSGDDFVTVKYLPDGTGAWTNYFSGPDNGTDRAYGLAVDGGGNVYVTGESAGAGSSYDFATVKYLPDGTPAWTNRFNGPDNGPDRARALALDGAGNVYVTGEFSMAVAGNNFATIKYLPDGTPVWTNTLNIARTSQDVNNALAVDTAGNVFVSAYPGPAGGDLDWTVAKYLTDGTPAWTNHYGGSASGYDVVNALAVDAAGNLLVAGVSSDSGTGQNLAVVKYLPDGTPAWTNLFHGSGDDVGSALAVDGVGRVFVVGRSWDPVLGWGLVTLGYQADGTPLWTNRFDRAGSGLDLGAAIAVDGPGNVFVTGSSAGSGTGQDIVTLKYRPDGVPVWTNVFAGALNQDDNGAAITVDAAGRVFLTGVADGQFTTLAYWQPANRTVLEDAGPQGEAGFAIHISPGPAHEAGQTVSFVVTNDNPALFSAQPAVAPNGALAFTAAPNANGSATVTVIAVDDGGAPGVSNSAPQTFTLTVTPVNDAPSFSLSGTNVTVFPGDGGVVARANWANSISAGPADESGQSVAFTTTNSNPVFFVDQPVLLANGTLEFTPEPAATGVVTVGVRATDNGGTDNGGVNASGWQTFTITLASVKVFVNGAPTVIAGSTVEVPVSLAGVGTEGGVSFTLTYDRPRLVFQSIAVEPGSGLTLTWTEPPDMTSVGIIVTKAAGAAFPAGTNVMVRLTFQAPVGTAPTNTPIGFSSAPVLQQVSDVIAGVIPNVLYVPGSVGILPVPPLEGDVAPRTGGSGTVTVSDAVQLTRFVAGWDTITDFTANGEFQRADCAPRGALGDGRVTLIDLVQALRYAAGLDPATPAGGPMVQAAALASSSSRLVAGSRVVRVVGGNLAAGRANTVSIQLDAQGNEAGLSLSVSFDPTAMTFVNAGVGGGASGGSLVVNDAKAAAGRVGLVLVMPAGASIAAGTRDVIALAFHVTGAGSTAISLTGDSPVAREVADVGANVLGASFVGGSFNLVLPPGLKAAGLERAADGSLRLVVVNRDGSPVTAAQAAKYEVHVTGDLGGAWVRLPNALVVEQGALKIVDPAASGAGLRLYKLVELP